MSTVGDALLALARAAVDGARIEVTRPAGPALASHAAWNAFGLRDPVVHVDHTGEPLDPAAPTVFFNGRDAAIAAGGRTQVGCARWPASGPVPAAAPVFTDGAYAAAGSVVRGTDGGDRLFYSPDTARGLARACRTADRWEPDGRILLEPARFGCSRVGLPYVTAVEDGWIMVFEGMRRGTFALYAATSRDGVDWTPSHDGEPIYAAAPGGWDARGQANPSLVVRDGAGVLLFNGEAKPHAWEVGALVSDDVIAGTWRATSQPLLPRGKAGAWDGGRLEGARALRAVDGGVGILYFGLPTQDSYRDGAIGYAELRVAA